MYKELENNYLNFLIAINLRWKGKKRYNPKLIGNDLPRNIIDMID